MTRHIRLLGVAAAAIVGALAAAPAYAGTSTSTAAITALVGGSGLAGTRTITAFPAVALTGTAALSGLMDVTVTETAALGDANGWSVTVQSSALNETPSGGGSIPASNLAMTNIVVPSATGCLTLALGSGGCTVSSGSGGTLDSAQTVFSVSPESSTVSYSGVYTGAATLNLSVPNGTPAGAYAGTLTATLIQ